MTTANRKQIAALNRRIQRMRAALTLAQDALWRMNAEYCVARQVYPASNAELDYAREVVDDTLEAETDVDIDCDIAGRA